MGERNRLGQILVEPKLPGDRPSDLRDLQRVGQPRAVMIALVRQKDLRLVRQPPESRGVQHAVTVALERASRRARRFVMKTPPRRNCTRRMAGGRPLAGFQISPVILVLADRS